MTETSLNQTKRLVAAKRSTVSLYMAKIKADVLSGRAVPKEVYCSKQTADLVSSILPKDIEPFVAPAYQAAPVPSLGSWQDEMAEAEREAQTASELAKPVWEQFHAWLIGQQAKLDLWNAHGIVPIGYLHSEIIGRLKPLEELGLIHSVDWAKVATLRWQVGKVLLGKLGMRTS